MDQVANESSEVKWTDSRAVASQIGNFCDNLDNVMLIGVCAPCEVKSDAGGCLVKNDVNLAGVSGDGDGREGEGGRF